MDIQETAYLGWMIFSLLFSFGLFGILGLRDLPAGSSPRRTASRLRPALLSLLAGTLCALLGAKLFYYLCQIDFMIAAGWQETLFRLNPEELSFFGGAAGLCLGVSLAARLSGLRPMALLNRFAPYGLLFGALARFGETFLGQLGVGPYLEPGPLCFFPLAKGFSYGDDWTEWYLAVFALEGLTLLAVAALSRWRLKARRFLRRVFYLCLPQILLENLRLGSFMWFFCIRVEQLACMVAMFLILILYGVRAKGQPRRFLPALVSLLCAGLFIVCEFAMEGKIGFLRFLNIEACYALMFAGQLVLAAAEIAGFRKMQRAA